MGQTIVIKRRTAKKKDPTSKSVKAVKVAKVKKTKKG